MINTFWLKFPYRAGCFILFRVLHKFCSRLWIFELSRCASTWKETPGNKKGQETCFIILFCSYKKRVSGLYPDLKSIFLLLIKTCVYSYKSRQLGGTWESNQVSISVLDQYIEWSWLQVQWFKWIDRVRYWFKVNWFMVFVLYVGAL